MANRPVLKIYFFYQVIHIFVLWNKDEIVSIRLSKNQKETTNNCQISDKNTSLTFFDSLRELAICHMYLLLKSESKSKKLLVCKVSAVRTYVHYTYTYILANSTMSSVHLAS